MTELTEPESAAAQPSPDWPGIRDAGVTDTVVAQALARLEALPEVPVADHENVYNELHDELLAALNTVPNNSAPTSAVPTNGPA
ncbi:hypothetical protein [Arthrobacter sp. OY3WO11]|jgi:hypothetical protein|uniref:hypothetical protein n=1 Tax=Arthrobacter sp. OY3WO11 TaxID=1835723 RepID=UPI0007CF8A68|nr:hypothetical protein [Arthrobacter sp. OY3WO11]OAE01450.1 hypothetical protein A6A22_08460 [Arthrobacter sp. OY3WO11]